VFFCDLIDRLRVQLAKRVQQHQAAIRLDKCRLQIRNLLVLLLLTFSCVVTMYTCDLVLALRIIRETIDGIHYDNKKKRKLSTQKQPHFHKRDSYSFAFASVLMLQMRRAYFKTKRKIGIVDLILTSAISLFNRSSVARCNDS
jgi:hypothetical protein